MLLTTNSLTGPLSQVEWPRLKQLQWLSLAANMLSGTLPPSLLDCTQLPLLRQVVLTSNHLFGEVRVRLAVDFTWALDTVSDGAPDRGCWWRRGQMTNAIYTPLVKADTAVNMGGVPFSIRGADDPYVVAQRVSEGTMCASLLSP